MLRIAVLGCGHIGQIHAADVETGARPLAGFEDDRRALILAEAAYVSMRDKRLVQVSEVTA